MADDLTERVARAIVHGAARRVHPGRWGVSAGRPVRRRARVAHYCGGCSRAVQPGEIYLRHVIFPGHDANPRGVWVAAGSGRPIPDRPRVSAECAECAIRYGRGGLL